MKLTHSKWSFSELKQEIPLAWSQLAHQKVRLCVALAGISFANILIFMQLGFRAAMFDGVTRVEENLQGDLFLVNRTSKFLGNTTFSRRQLYRVAAINGVESADSLYYNMTSWKNPITGELSDITVIAFNPVRPVMKLPDVNQQLRLIEQPDTVLFDRKSLASLGPVPETLDAGGDVSTEVGGRKIWVDGLFTMGSSLFKRGHIVTSDINYLRIFGKDSLNNVHVGILILRPDADIVAVTKQLQSILPPEVQVLNRDQFIETENRYWAAQPPGIIFNFGTVMGFIVGVVIVYQVLYNDVNDHLPEYATLKAIGYSDGKLLGIVFQEAVILALFGFLPGFAFSIGLYGVLGGLTRVVIVMRPLVATQVFILTVLMCLVSAAIASRKLRSADPADVF